MKNIKYAKTAVIAITVVMVFSMFLMLTDNVSASPAQSPFTIPQTPSGNFRFVGNMNPDKTITVSVVIPPDNTALMYSYAQGIFTPGSSLFHKFLTKSQIESKFMNQNEYKRVLSYLEGSGFNVEMTAMDSVIVVTGTVSQVNSALGMNVGLYSNGTATFYNAYGTPSIKGVYVYSSDVSKYFFSKPSTLVSPSQLESMNKKFRQVNPVASIEPYSPVWFQQTYNATGLYNKGDMGQGQTIGILDFGGDPYIQSQLNLYDSLYNLPNVNINITPIGNYTPEMGILTGWNGEISLDVEISHTMAPEANITLYIANITLNLLPVIAQIDNYNSVNDLSQSFSIPESEYYYFLNASTAYYNVILTDEYYLMGSLEGISFMASTGDAGASGYSAGPLGTVGYPSTSPWVTAVGGTTTYVALNTQVMMDSFGVPVNPVSDVAASNQTAWSNYGFVPYNINYGGGTGGISMFEPEPLYQAGTNLPNPKPVGYPNGRMVPDVSFEASPYPGGLFVFTNNTGSPQLGISGGTSESSPLFAGLVTLMDQYLGMRAGALSPVIYAFGNQPSLYSKLFNPVTFGYNTPYVNTYGYNLVNGFGSINIGAFSTYLKGYITQTSVYPYMFVTVNTTDPLNTTPAEFPDGSTIGIQAYINDTSGVISTGSFNASLDSTQGYIAKVALTYNSTSKEWIGKMTVPANSEGMAFLYVFGQSAGLEGLGFTQLFLGYYVNYLLPPELPYLVQDGIYIFGNVTLINGNPVPGMITLNISLESYSYLNNTYYTTFPMTEVQVFNGSLMYLLQANIPYGITLLETGGAYGTIPFYNGAMLQNSIILGNIIAEPGVAAPGTDIYVQGIANGPFFTADSGASYNTTLYSTITFYLLNSQNKPISNVTNNFVQSIQYGQLFGLLPVPVNATPGYHNILIESSYFDPVLDMFINGSFYGQIYISAMSSVPNLAISPTAVYEGENITLNATVPNLNGMNTEFGMYTATVYPVQLAPSYSIITQLIEVPLYFDTATGNWSGVIQMPGGTSSNVLAGLYGQSIPLGMYFPGTYNIFLAGQSSNGIPTNTSPMNALPFILRDGPFLSIMSPTNGIESLTTNSSTVISGETTAAEVTINNVPVSISNGTFTVTEQLSVGINTFNVIAVDGSGGVTTFTVTVLYLPQINQIESQLQSISVSLNNLQTKNLTAINTELNNLTVETNTLKSTFGIQLTNITNEINTLKAKLNSTEASLSQTTSKVNTTSTSTYDLSLGAMAVAIISIIVAAIAISRKTKK